MPEFVLNTPRKPHGFYDLSEFGQGYVEAMFHTNGNVGDDELSLNDLGTEALTPEALFNIGADCAKFEDGNVLDLVLARSLIPGNPGFEYAREPISVRRCGNLFWYARQGHGVSWEDDGDAPSLRALQKASRAFGEAYVDVIGDSIEHN